MSAWIRVRLLLVALVLPACGDGGGSGGGGSVVDDATAVLGLDASGGSAGGAGTGGPGGGIRLAAHGVVETATRGSSPAFSPPAAPSEGTMLTADRLAADVTVQGTILITGDLPASGDAKTRTIRSQGGDIVVSGTLRAQDLGATTQDLVLEAPDGRIFVTGSVLAISDDGVADGNAGGRVVLSAGRDVVVTGSIVVDGEAGGGAAGAVEARAGTTLYVLGSISARGGRGEAAGGAGGRVVLQGGDAAGDGRAIRAAGPFRAAGGSGGGAGGDGGSIELYSFAGGVLIDGELEAPGGASATAAGDGGTIRAWCDVGGGAVRTKGTLSADGGPGTGPDADGGKGGLVSLEAYEVSGVEPHGSVYVEAGSRVEASGGPASGSGAGGAGGLLLCMVAEGVVSFAGSLSCVGGASPSGPGGRGGGIAVFSDENASGTGGHITVETTGLLEASGGDGIPGGSARNPEGGGTSTDPRTNAVVLDSDSGAHTPGNTDRGGVIQNLGLIVARGGVSGGSGGYLNFHGIGTGGYRTDPVPGNVDLRGNGGGQDGQAIMD